MKNNALLKKYFSYVGVFTLFLICLSFFLTTDPFIDENDNFVGGMIVAGGGDVYSDHVSQHMPVMYYICAIFRLLGANTITEFRLFFYGFLALLWMCMYIRYSRFFSKFTMILIPIGYCVTMSFYLPCSATAISDQVQAQGMIILLLELLMFIKTREITIKTSIWISIAIFISFGSAFVSLFAIFIVALTVLVLEIVDCITEKRGFIKGFVYLLNKYWKLFVIVLSPFIILMLWYLVTGNLYNFYVGAYKINTTIYSKYLDGYGENPIRTLLGGLDGFIGYLRAGISELPTNTIDGAIKLIFIFINVTFTTLLFKKNKIAALFIMYFAMMCAPRGFIGFHSMAYYGVSVAMAVIMLNNIYKKHGSKIPTKQLLCIVFATLIFSSPYLAKFSSVLSVPRLLMADPKESGYAAVINQITEKDDKIYLPHLETSIYIQSDRLPILTAPSSVPWMYEALGTREMQVVSEAMPKVAIFEKNFEVWGYKQIEYAPEINAFISENYTNLGIPDAPLLHVRNDLLDESRAKLNIIPTIFDPGIPDGNIGLITDRMEVSQTFKFPKDPVSGISVKFGTFGKQNKSQLTAEIYDVDTDTLVHSSDFDVENLVDNSYNNLIFDYDFKANTTYEIKLVANSDSSGGGFVTVYNTAPGTSTPDMYATIDGVKQDYNLSINLLGKN